MPEENDHTLLIRIDERVKKMNTCLDNHLRHHWAVTIGLIVALAAAVAKLILK